MYPEKYKDNKFGPGILNHEQHRNGKWMSLFTLLLLGCSSQTHACMNRKVGCKDDQDDEH